MASSGCWHPFTTYMPNVPTTSGPLNPLQQCSQPDGANAYLELDVESPDRIKTVGRALVFTQKHGWETAPAGLITLQLVRIDDVGHSLLSWQTDLHRIDWMGAAYQSWPGSTQVNTLHPDVLNNQEFTEQVIVHPVVGERFAVWAALPRGAVQGLSCYATNGRQAFLT